jgi:membrane protein DedA with SNARE-associated domain
MLEYIEAHYIGVFILVISIVVLGTWIAWVSSIGRYKGASNKPGVMFVLSDLVVKIINDFRHLLALLLVTIFALALAYSMYIAQSLDDLTTAIQLVMSTLGGLVGSIVGYYFGESAVKRALKAKNDEHEEIDSVVQEGSENIKQVQPPPDSN